MQRYGGRLSVCLSVCPSVCRSHSPAAVARGGFAAVAAGGQRRNATIRGRSHFLRSGSLKLITKNSRTVGGPLPPVGPPVTRRSSHPIVTPLLPVM